MNGLWSKGGWAGFRSKVGEKPYNAKYKFKYMAPGVDFMFNLSNLFCGWNPNRVFNISAFAGGGINWAGANQEVNDIAPRLRTSTTTTWNISGRERRFALTAEPVSTWNSR